LVQSWIDLSKSNASIIDGLPEWLLVGKGNMVCDAINIFRETGGVKKHALVVHINENWGAFSSEIPNRTINWGGNSFSRESHDGGCGRNDLWYYLNHTNVSAIFTTTHQNAIEPHPKVFSLPLGVKKASEISRKLHEKPMAKRTKLLMINQSHRLHRPSISESVIANFNGTIRNTYMKDGMDYWQQLHEAKFILCPSGLGYDTYRSWEALVMGAIPVLETYYRQDGFYRVYDDLPVLWVDHYDNVTPSLLEEAYPRILSKAHEYKFEKLTNQWWVDLINSYRPSTRG